MPKKSKAALPSIPKELIDPFVTDLIERGRGECRVAGVQKALIERALGAELKPPAMTETTKGGGLRIP